MQMQMALENIYFVNLRRKGPTNDFVLDTEAELGNIWNQMINKINITRIFANE